LEAKTHSHLALGGCDGDIKFFHKFACHRGSIDTIWEINYFFKEMAEVGKEYFGNLKTFRRIMRREPILGNREDH